MLPAYLKNRQWANPTTYQNTSFWRQSQWSIGVTFCLHLLLMCPSQSSLPTKPPPCPVFPDCYHNSLALYHQNISSYLLSKNSCFLSAVSFYITKGEKKCPSFIGAMWIWYHSREISCWYRTLLCWLLASCNRFHTSKVLCSFVKSSHSPTYPIKYLLS